MRRSISSGASSRRVKEKSQEKHEQTDKETGQSRKQKNLFIHGRQEDREEESKKGKKAEAV